MEGEHFVPELSEFGVGGGVVVEGEWVRTGRAVEMDGGEDEMA